VTVLRIRETKGLVVTVERLELDEGSIAVDRAVVVADECLPQIRR
jgi:hypothetical protein